MFHPVGNHATSVYWRRRFMLIASLVVVLVLMVLTVRAMSTGATGSRALGAGSGAPGPGTHPSPHTTSRAASSTASSRRATHSRHRNATQSRHSSSVSSDPTTSAPPAPCVAKNLDVQAVVARPTYKVGQHPEVELQVTDVGAAPCVQDLADKQVVLKVYNGESRVWGSHDCQIEPGTDDRTLEVGSPVRVSIVWSGLTSRPGCAGTRQRVGAGTYTLYAALSGHSGKATQFSIT